MRKKFLFMLMAVAMIFSSSASAARIDIYRNAILNKSYTIKYEISQVPIYQSRNDATFSDEGLKEKIPVNFGKKLIQKGIAVADGNDKYVETSLSNSLRKISINHDIHTSKIPSVGICKLIKNNEVFNFLYEIKKDKKNYYTPGTFGKTQSVKAVSNDLEVDLYPYQNLVESYSLGSAVLDDIFAAIIPPERLIATPSSPIYQSVSSGTAKDGLFFEDFASNKENIFSAIRYYFDGDNLIKVAHVSYLKDGNKLQAYEKFVVDITEFSTIPDKKYLSLPEGLKDKTKRNEANKK